MARRHRPLFLVSGIVIDTCMIDGLPHATVFWFDLGVSKSSSLHGSNHDFEGIMEQISFVIPFGDTTDPQKVAKKLAKELQFCEWYASRRQNAATMKVSQQQLLPLWAGQRSGRMLVKDLKVGAMYRLQSFGAPGKYNFGYFPDFEDCMVSILNGPGLGNKFVYLGTQALPHKEGTIDATRRTLLQSTDLH